MEQLLELLGEVRPDVDFAGNTALIDNGVLDSLNIMEIVAEICDAFDIEISPADIVPANFNSADAMWQMIQRIRKQ
ncbi:acyl carrier protein [Anaerocaecibacter muris]|uniref:acyl carrier protein n=1 Tax=Anaerocaecibacter muris TaxID=2941513 RepID=UPI003F68F164